MRRCTPPAAALCAVLLAPVAAGAVNLGVDAELGYQLSVGAAAGPVQLNRPYAIVTGRYRAEGLPQPLGITFEAAVRGWYDLASSSAMADPRSLKGTLTANRWKATVGLQSVAWGESFGIYIADIVNPRDLTDILLNDLAWMRIPVFAVNVQLLYEAFSLQLVGVPLGDRNRIAAAAAPGDFFPISAPRMNPPLPRLGSDSEFGARVGWLFDFGLDASLIFYQHRNRNPVYNPIVENQALVLQPVLDTVQTFGATFSQAWNAVAARGDIIFHRNTPLQDFQDFSISRGPELQAILGADWVNDTVGTLGLQWHMDTWPDRFYTWASARAARDFLAEELGVELFVFKGLNNSDLWVQAQLHWRPGSSWDLSVRGDILGPKEQSPRGMLASMRTRQRLYTWVSWRF